MNGKQMEKAGMIIAVDSDYLTDDGRVIFRVYKGMSTTPKWRVEGKEFLHRSLFEAYYELEY